VESDEVDTTGKACKGQAPGETFSRRIDEVESDSDASDDGLMVQYGAQRVSTRRKDPKQATTDETDENEVALALLGGRSKKRPLSLSKGSKAKKSRLPRDSDSEESDEASIVCELCNKKIPKELYRQHADEELEARERAKKNVPRKAGAWARITICPRLYNFSGSSPSEFKPRPGVGSVSHSCADVSNLS